MFNVRCKDLRIAVTDAAMRELVKEGKTLLDIVTILEEGYDAPRKRKEGVTEKWLDKWQKTWNAVVAKDYDEVMKEECLVLIHFGKFGRRKTR